MIDGLAILAGCLILAICAAAEALRAVGKLD
jgi:hypothetical protein